MRWNGVLAKENLSIFFWAVSHCPWLSLFWKVRLGTESKKIAPRG
jgi:hypothetical protein